MCSTQAYSSSSSSSDQQLYLIQFASGEYAQFRLAEFASLAGWLGCRFATVFTGRERESDWPANMPERSSWSDELFEAACHAGVHDWSGLGTGCCLRDLCSMWWRSRPLVALLCDDQAKLVAVARRSALVKRLLRVWRCSATQSEMLADVSDGRLRGNLAEVNAEFDRGTWTRWRMCVELVNVSAPMEVKVDVVERFGSAGLEMPGRVDLKRPELELYYVEHWRYDLAAGGVTDASPVMVYFARRLNYGSNMRSVLPSLCLAKRVFIGNTSMNVQLAFVMCNLARVSSGQLVVDPFVGSGSILVSAGYLGAYCIGQDVDYNITLGLGKSTKAEARKQMRSDGECLLANFQQYGMPERHVACLVGDASQHVGLWRQGEMFDAVLTDPPYGIRERSRKVKRDPEGGPKKLDQEYFPPKVHYSLADSVTDLMQFAALKLRPGGRCVYWFPVIHSEYQGAPSLPTHPSFRLVASVELPMTRRTSRVLVCAEKLPTVDASWHGIGADSQTVVSHDHCQLRSSHFSAKRGLAKSNV